MSDPAEEQDLMTTIIQVNDALEETASTIDKPVGAEGKILSLAAVKMGWTLDEMEKFVQAYGPMLIYKNDDIPTIEAPTEALIDNHLPSGKPTDIELAAMVARADSNLKLGLRRMKLSDDEAEIAVALAEFNGGFFMESSGMVSAQVLQTALKLGTQQRQIEERLKEVRDAIAIIGPEATPIREQWVQEERMLSYQYIDIGRLLTDIQANWYKGAAQLALMKMKMREHGGSNGQDNGKYFKQRSTNKPGFRATKTIDANGGESED